MNSKKRQIIIFAIPVIALAIILSVLIYSPEKEIFRGDFADVLPPNTASICYINDFEGLWNTGAGMQTFQKIYRSDAIQEELKLSDKSENKPAFQNFRLSLAKNFMFRWLGKELCIAVIPGVKQKYPFSILVMSRTESGFEQKLAKFITEHHPDVKLRKSQYNNEEIYSFQTENKRDSFCCMLLGRTLFLSARNSDTQILKNILDLKENPSIPSLSTVSGFKDFSKLKNKHSVSLYSNLQRLFLFLKQSGEESDSETIRESLSTAQSLFKDFREMQMFLSLSSDIRITAEFLGKATPTQNNISIPREFRSLEYFENNDLAFLGIKHNRIHTIYPRLIRIYTQDKPDSETRNEILFRILTELGNILEKEIVLNIDQLEPGLLFPVVNASLHAGVEDETQARDFMYNFLPADDNSEEKNAGRVSTPAGILSFRLKNKMLNASLTQGMKKEDKTGKNASFPELENSTFFMKFNLETLHRNAVQLEKGSSFWKEKYRERTRRLKKWSEVLSHFQNITIWNQLTQKSVIYELKMPLEK